MDERTGKFVRIPNELFTLGLSASELSIYAYLLYCENHRRHLCYPSYRTIGDALGMCRNTVRKYVGSLVEKHLVETEETQVVINGRRRNGNLKYTFLPLKEAEKYRMARQMEAVRLEAAKQNAARKLANFDQGAR